MRYYSYNELHENGTDNVVVTVSEDDIRRNYFPYWYDQMCRKFGEDVVRRDYSFDDCLDDWIVVNWAWEVIE